MSRSTLLCLSLNCQDPACDREHLQECATCHAIARSEGLSARDIDLIINWADTGKWRVWRT